jgi:hypothetical protein
MNPDDLERRIAELRRLSSQGWPPQTAMGLGEEADRARARLLQPATAAAAQQQRHENWTAIDNLVREFIPEAVRRGIKPKGLLIKSWRVVHPILAFYVLRIYANGRWALQEIVARGGIRTRASSRRPNRGCAFDGISGLREGAVQLLSTGD